MSKEIPLLAPRRLFALVAIAYLFAAATTIPFRHLWELDEPRYAEAAREMITTGDWLVPHVNGEVYGQKPPLYIWLVGLLRLAGLGWTPAGVLPALAAMGGSLLLVRRFAGEIGEERDGGWVAAVVFGTSLLPVALAFAARMDMILVLTHTCALLLATRLLGLIPGRPPCRRDHLLFWAVLGIGVLVKGPVALALPLLSALGAAAWLRPRPRLRPLFVGWGPLVAVAIVLAWLVPAGVVGGGAYLKEILVTQSAGRISASFAHRQPFWYHLVTYPFTALPWSPLVLIAAWRALRRRNADAVSFLAVTAAVTLVFFSLVSGKLVVYLLPFFPAAALLAVSELRRDTRGTRSALLVGAIGLSLVGWGTAGWLLGDPKVAFLRPAIPAAIVIGVAALGALVVVVRRGAAAGLVAVAAAAALVPAALLPTATWALDERSSVLQEARAIVAAEPGATRGAWFDARFAGLVLYSERLFDELRDEAELRQALSQGRVVVVEEGNVHRLAASMPGSYEELSRYPLLNKELVLIRGVPPRPAD